MTPEQINKRFAELAGIPWHKWERPQKGTLYGSCACGRVINITKREWEVHPFHRNPDFCADPRLVLEVMEKREDFNRWIAVLNGLSLDEDNCLIDNAIPIDYILDKTGKLAMAAITFLEAK